MIYDVLIVGNGSIALAIAYDLQLKEPNLKVGLMGRWKYQKPSASLAAGGMLNHFAEIDHILTFGRKAYVDKFELGLMATEMWKQTASELGIKLGEGTYILNSTYGDEYDDNNLRAIVEACGVYNRHGAFTYGSPRGVDPISRYRSKGLFHMRNEGWVNPADLMCAYECKIRANRIDAYAEKITKNKKTGLFDVRSNESVWKAKQVVAAPGAYFGQIEISGLKTQKITYGTGFGFTVQIPNLWIEQVIRSTNRSNACGITVVPRSPTTYYIGATYEHNNFPGGHVPRLGHLYWIIDQLAKEVNPKFLDALLLETHYGHRPISEDDFPLAGKTSIEGLHVVTGTRRDGLFMSPYYGRLTVSNLLTPGTYDYFPDMFKVERKPHKFISKDSKAYIDAKYADAYKATHRLE
jgi:glycine oxidase